MDGIDEAGGESGGESRGRWERGGVFGSRGCGLEGAATSLLRHARAEPSGARRRPGYPGLIRNNSRTEARARDGASEVYASKLQLLDSGALHRQLKHGSTSNDL